MPTKTFTDQRVLDAMTFIVTNRINGIEDEKTFLLSIGYDNPNNITLIRQGTQSFRTHHLQNICESYNIDGNYFLKRGHVKMYTEAKTTNPLDYLREAVKLVETIVDKKKLKAFDKVIMKKKSRK